MEWEGGGGAENKKGERGGSVTVGPHRIHVVPVQGEARCTHVVYRGFCRHSRRFYPMNADR